MTPPAEQAPPAGRLAAVAGHETTVLDSGWEAAAAAPGAPSDAPELQWIPAQVPGTAAGALRAAGLWDPAAPRDLDGEDWLFRTRFACAAPEAGERLLLRLDGVATVWEASLNGERLHSSESMFERSLIDLGGRVRGENELLVRCHALSPRLAGTRRPRARWRTALVAERNLRFFRTMLLGRAPGSAPGPAVVGPWRGIALERRRGCAVGALRLAPRVEQGTGVLELRAVVEGLAGDAPAEVALELTGPTGTHAAACELGEGPGGARSVHAEVRVPGAALWWPHTHGEPVLYRVLLRVRAGGAEHEVDAGRVGFRTIARAGGEGAGGPGDGVDIHINGAPVFVRGAVWPPSDLFAPTPPEAVLRERLQTVRAAGMNMLRLPGTGAYEQAAFHDLCDELGLLVWQDLMFANFDYPFADEGFRGACEREIAAELAALAGRPSLAVVCGNSEVEQQATMMGLDPALPRDPFFYETAPAAVGAAGCDALYVPSTPCGGELPFRPDAGVANYYGVGAYRRALSDLRTSGVRFAAEALAFANVPGETLDGRPDPAISGAGTPRDVGADWDFADVRDHYLGELYGVDAGALRSDDPDRYAQLSRAITGEVMAEAFGEWRREASPCRGALVLWLKDLAAGAGWGLLDAEGRPKPALAVLRRVLAPAAVWMVDEGLGGFVVHAANDGPEPLRGELRISLYRDFEQPVGEARTDVAIAAHGSAWWNVETLLGRFADISWAYRFGPPAQDLVVAALTDAQGRTISRALRLPAGLPPVEDAGSLGLRAELLARADGARELTVHSRRLAHRVSVACEGFEPQDDLFSVEPGGSHRIILLPRTSGASGSSVRLSALNLAGRLEVAEAGN